MENKIAKIIFNLDNGLNWRPCVEEYENAIVDYIHREYPMNRYSKQYEIMFYLTKEQFLNILSNDDFKKTYVYCLKNTFNEWYKLSIKKQLENEEIDEFDDENLVNSKLYFFGVYIAFINEGLEEVFGTQDDFKNMIQIG